MSVYIHQAGDEVSAVKDGGGHIRRLKGDPACDDEDISLDAFGQRYTT
jgi:hypothetical protein